MPEKPFVLPLPQPMIIEVVGKDAAQVLNNLSTNDISSLKTGEHLETFITDLRGWTVAHGFLLKLEDRVILLGQHTDAASVCNHIDRYIIREDARVADLSKSQLALILDVVPSTTEIAGVTCAEVRRLAAPITSPHCQLLLGEPGQFQLQGEQIADASEFELRRIRNFWPTFGKDILEKCIPQELDRDARAISFTKGCYLGQETIARLDARGQLQKKLCLLKFDAEGPHVGDPLTSQEITSKEVGKITSVAFDPSEASHYALAFLRRGSFAVGTQVRSRNGCGTVLAIPG